jgi:hypothetical protein
MRYEHIELDISTAACDTLHRLLCLDPYRLLCLDPYENELVPALGPELELLRNQLYARLQHRDPDPQSLKNDNTDLTS